MKTTLNRCLTTALLGLSLTPAIQAEDCCDRGIRLNEIRHAHNGDPENHEYTELFGPAGESLDGVCYLVIGPGGVIEELIDLSGQTLDANGYFTMGQQPILPFWGVAVDLVVNLNFVNNGNRTHLLVCCENGLPGWGEDVDVDQENDGVVDMPLWDCVLDCIALVQFPAQPFYCPTFRGPTAAGNAPSHVWRCQPPGIWRMGAHDLAASNDTPDSQNPGCPPLWAFGLGHFALGEATLELQGGVLTVANIGSSGLDGVRIDLGEAESACVGLNAAADGVTTLSAYGRIDGAAVMMDVLLVETTMNGGGLSRTFTTHFGQPGESLTYMVLDDGVLVGQTTGTAGQPVVANGVSSAVVMALDPPPIFPPGWPQPTDWPPFGTTLDMAGNDVEWSFGATPGTITGDQLVIVPTQFRSYDAMNFVEVTGLGVSEFAIVGESLWKHQHSHTALGEAQFEANLGDLTINNIGSSGQDGVCIELPATHHHAVSTSATGLSTGDAAQMAWSSIIGGPLIGTFTATLENGQVQLDGVIDTLPHYFVYDAVGNLVHDHVGPATFVGPLFPAGWETETAPDGQPMLAATWPEEQTLTIEFASPGDLTVIGSRIEVRRAEPGPPVDAGGFLDIRAAGIDQLVILSEESSDIDDCPSDIDGDGAIGVNDLLFVLGAWGSDDADADLNGDGTVDVSDVLQILADWGNC